MRRVSKGTLPIRILCVTNHYVNDLIEGNYYRINRYFKTAFIFFNSNYLRNYISKLTNYCISRGINQFIFGDRAFGR